MEEEYWRVNNNLDQATKYSKKENYYSNLKSIHQANLSSPQAKLAYAGHLAWFVFWICQQVDFQKEQIELEAVSEQPVPQ